VRLEVSPEFSNLSAKTTQISEDFQAPVLNVRKIKTIVTVKDGQTVVIGGLIENRAERRNAKVPLLGDIPVLGIPFRSDVVQRTKTELLVLLTPHILRQPEAYDIKTEHELKLLNIPDDRKEVLRGSDFSDLDPFDFEADGPFLGEEPEEKKREDEPEGIQEEIEEYEEAIDEVEPGAQGEAADEEEEDDPVPPALLHF
jgi:hypothetical protein